MINHKPLYLQARDKTLGPVEIMDKETLNWIKRSSASEFHDIHFVTLSDNEVDTLKKFSPKREWFYSQEHALTIHGVAHCARVAVTIVMICKKLGIKDSSPYILAASIHDVRRVNDNEDKEHGNRAAEWFNTSQAENYKMLFSPSQIKLIDNIVKWHQVDYSEIDQQSLDEYKLDVDIIKAADALDRYRMPKESWWPDVNKIELEDAHQFIGFCRELTLRSESMILDGVNPNDAVINTYIELLEEYKDSKYE